MESIIMNYCSSSDIDSDVPVGASSCSPATPPNLPSSTSASSFSTCLSSGLSSSSNPDQLTDHEWTRYQEKLFENAHVEFNVDTPSQEAFEKVALRVPGKTPEEIEKHYQLLVDDLELISSGGFPIPDYVPTDDHDEQIYDVQDGNQENDVQNEPDLKQKSNRKGPIKHPNRKKAVPWTEEEHSLFLEGLRIYGRGDWRSISRNCVRSRTPTQVASHAQKYFIRMNNQTNSGITLGTPGDRRQLSINDIRSLKQTTKTIGLSSSFGHGSGSGANKYVPIAPASFLANSAPMDSSVPQFTGTRFNNGSMLHSEFFLAPSASPAKFTPTLPQQQQPFSQVIAHCGFNNNGASSSNYATLPQQQQPFSPVIAHCGFNKNGASSSIYATLPQQQQPFSPVIAHCGFNNNGASSSNYATLPQQQQPFSQVIAHCGFNNDGASSSSYGFNNDIGASLTSYGFDNNICAASSNFGLDNNICASMPDYSFNDNNIGAVMSNYGFDDNIIGASSLMNKQSASSGGSMDDLLASHIMNDKADEFDPLGALQYPPQITETARTKIEK